MAESDTWEGEENLENAKEAIKEYEREINIIYKH